MSISLDQSVREQRESLKEYLRSSFAELAQYLAPIITDQAKLEDQLRKSCPDLNHCKYLYVMNHDGVQVTGNIFHDGIDNSQIGRDRSERPYMQGMYADVDFRLSGAYISRNKKRPSLTAIQVIRDEKKERIGFLGVDYDLRELPQTGALYKESDDWRQVKGDPAIRGGLFQQHRKQSKIDNHLDDILPLLEELMTEYGIFHSKIHFSGSRASVWHTDDPYTYRSLDIEQLSDPDICLAYPRREYFERSIVPVSDIMKIFKMFRVLRFEDDVVYLRSGSLNLVNGMVGLTFSCDGSHYIRYDDFLQKGLEFWFGD